MGMVDGDVGNAERGRAWRLSLTMATEMNFLENRRLASCASVRRSRQAG